METATRYLRWTKFLLGQVPALTLKPVALFARVSRAIAASISCISVALVNVSSLAAIFDATSPAELTLDFVALAIRRRFRALEICKPLEH
jgi:hypothetical protein